MVVKKRAAVIAALCMLLLLMLPRPSRQQFFDHSCDCYRKCYLECKNAFPMLCKVVCGGSCNDNKDPVVTCMVACCTDSICGLSPAPSGKRSRGPTTLLCGSVRRGTLMKYVCSFCCYLVLMILCLHCHFAYAACAPDCIHACEKMWGGHGPAKEP